MEKLFERKSFTEPRLNAFYHIFISLLSYSYELLNDFVQKHGMKIGLKVALRKRLERIINTTNSCKTIKNINDAI